MATTEGALIASTNRGAKAISVSYSIKNYIIKTFFKESGGVKVTLLRDFMTRTPVLRFNTIIEAK